MEEGLAQKQSFSQRLTAVGAKGWQSFVDVLTPPLCLSCAVPVSQGGGLCPACWQKLRFIGAPVCDALGIPFAYDQGEGALSPAAIADPPAWDKGRAAVAFDEASRALVHQLKYRDRQEAGLAMARMMTGAGRELLAESDMIIPVPLHRWRLWRRRFNQAAFLAQQISQHSGLSWQPDVLLRVMATTPQVGLDAETRRRNVRRAFEVPFDKRPLIDGKAVLLVDDVRTTGATGNACAAALKAAGARKVHMLSFALVLEPTRLHIVDT